MSVATEEKLVNLEDLKDALLSSLELPTVSASDEGKILQVNSSGEWEASSALLGISSQIDSINGEVI